MKSRKRERLLKIRIKNIIKYILKEKMLSFLPVSLCIQTPQDSCFPDLLSWTFSSVLTILIHCFQAEATNYMCGVMELWLLWDLLQLDKKSVGVKCLNVQQHWVPRLLRCGVYSILKTFSSVGIWQLILSRTLSSENSLGKWMTVKKPGSSWP